MLALFFRLLVRGIRDLFKHPWLQTLTLAAVVLVTLLTGLFLLVLHNLDLQLQKNRGQIEFQVFWQQAADMEEVRAQWEKMEEMPHLVSKKTFSPEEGFNNLNTYLSPL
ncbi:MAG: hypothetical protein ACOC0U_05025, partial [Desulfovibrionales bacterium]